MYEYGNLDGNELVSQRYLYCCTSTSILSRIFFVSGATSEKQTTSRASGAMVLQAGSEEIVCQSEGSFAMAKIMQYRAMHNTAAEFSGGKADERACAPGSIRRYTHESSSMIEQARWVVSLRLMMKKQNTKYPNTPCQVAFLLLLLPVSRAGVFPAGTSAVKLIVSPFWRILVVHKFQARELGCRVESGEGIYTCDIPEAAACPAPQKKCCTKKYACL